MGSGDRKEKAVAKGHEEEWDNCDPGRFDSVEEWVQLEYEEAPQAIRVLGNRHLKFFLTIAKPENF